MMLLMALVCLPKVVLADELTVNDGTATNKYVPLYSYYADTQTSRAQFIQSAASLGDLTPGSQINSLTFYASYNKNHGGDWKLTLKEGVAGPLSVFEEIGDGELVYQGALAVTSNKLVITFSTPYTYLGGDLLIDLSMVTKGTCGTSSDVFYGVPATNGSAVRTYGSGTSNRSTEAFLPKMTLDYTPGTVSSCARPGKAVISDVTDESAVVTWSAAEGVTDYQYLLLAPGEEVDWSAAVTTSDTTAAFSGLEGNTTYSFAVRSYCGANEDEQSTAQRASFKTECGYIKAAQLPWAYGFEGAPVNGMPDCWDAILYNSYGSTYYPYVSGTSTHSGSSSLYFYGGTTSYGTEIAILPEVDPAINNSDLRIKLWYKNSSTNSSYSAYPYLAVGYMTDPTRALTFVGLDTLPQTSLYKQVELYLTDVPAGARIALKLVNGTVEGSQTQSTSSIYVDDVELSLIPSCRPPKDLHLESVDFTSATFAWTPANGEEAWKLQYKASNAADYEETSLSEPSFTIDGLEAATFYTYNFILHSDCEGELSVDSATYSIKFGTACDVMQPENDSIIFVGEAFTPCFSQALVAGTNTYEWTVSSDRYYITGASAANNARALIFPKMSLGDNWEVLFDAWTFSTNAADSILVYVSETPSLEGAIYVGAVKDFGTAAPADPYRLTLPAEVANQDLYLIFVGYHYSTLYLDNVVLTEKPGCMPVTGLDYVGTIADEENDGLYAATFTWSRGGEEDLWACYYAIKVDTVGAEYEYFSGVDDPAETPEDTIFTVHALEPNTRYVVLVGVQSGCDGGENLGAAVEREFSIKTPCGAISAVDYVEDFEDYAKGTNSTQPDVDCWSFLNVNLGTYPYAYVNNSSAYVHGGSQSLYFVSSSSSYTHEYAYAIMPQFAEDLREFRMNFWFKDENASSSGKLWVGYMTNADDESTFVALEEIARTTTFTKAQVSFNAIPAEVENYRIAFKYGGASSNYYLGIDDIALEFLPSCVAVTNLHVEDITATSAKIAWNPGKEETEWSVEVKKGSTVVYKDTIDVPYLLLDTLTSATAYTYTVLVKAMCDGAEAEEYLPAKTLTFTTACLNITALPWVEDFDAMTSGAVAPCWDNSGSTTATLNSTPSYVWGVLTTTGGNKVLRMYNSLVQSGRAEVNSPVIELPAEAVYMLSFDYSHRASCGAFTVGISADNGATFTELGSYGSTNTTTSSETPGTFEHVEINLTNYVGENVMIQFAAQSTYGTGAIFLDNVAIEVAPTCLKPENIHLVEGSVTLHEADFAWDGDAAQYEISLGTQTTIVNTNGVHMSGLEAGKNYVANFQVRAICQEGDTSAWTAVTPIRFATECEVISTFPWSNDFEAYESSMNAANIACWSAEWAQGTATKAAWSVSTTSAASGTKSISSTYISSQTSLSQLALPQMNIPEANAYEFVFKVHRDADSQSYKTDELRIFTNTTPDTIGATRLFNVFRQCSGVPVEAEAGTYQYAVTLPNAGEQYIVLQYYSEDGLGIYLDDFMVREIPSCLAASDLHVVDTLIGLDTAVIAWTPYDVENLNARVILVNGTDTVVDELVNDSIYVIRGLNPSTAYAYNAYVYTVCGELQAVDAAVKALSFATECAPIAALPWSTDFEGDRTGASNVPTCWTRPAGATYPYVYSTITMEGSKCLYAYTSSEAYIVSPEFAVELNGAVLSFLYKQGAASYSYPQLHVGVVSDPNSMADYMEIAAIERATSNTEVELTLENVPATHKYIVFKQSAGSYSTSLYVDNILVEPAPTCVKPSDIHVAAVGLDSAVIAWSGNAAQYELIIADTQKADTVIVSDTCYVLRGLTHSTAYLYAAMLRGVCAEGDSSKWVIASNLSFTTECGPITELPWSEDFEGASTCWTLGEGVSFATSTSYAKTGTKVLQFNKQNATTYAALPEFETELAALQFTYNWRCESNGSNSTMGYLEAGYMTDPSDISTFVQLQNHPEHKYAYEANTIYFPADVPAGARIAFRYSGQTGNYWLFVDDVEVRLAPTCKPVSNIHAENVTNSAASFAWTTNSGENEWILEIFKGTERLDSVLVYEPVFTIDTLAAETAYAYTVRVTASCGEGEYALPVEQVLSFTTLPACPLVTNIALAAVTENSATITWTAGLDENAWIVKTYLAGELQDSVEVSAENYTIMDLNANTKYTYTVVVLAKCGEEDFSRPAQAVLTFRTAMPADATEVMNATTNREFTADFSSTDEQAKWAVVDGYGPNQFVFGTAAAALLSEATAALYVSNDGASYYYGTNSTSGAMIFRQIELPNVDSLLVEFDWLANGEFTSGTYYDYGVAILAPVAAELSIATNTLKVDGNTWSATSVPAGVFDLVDGRVMATKTVAQHSAVKLETVEAGVYKIVIGWRNDTSGGAQNPLSICNLSVKILDEAGDDPTAMDAVNADENVEKFLYNGKVYIRRGNTVYTVLGQQVK